MLRITLELKLKSALGHIVYVHMSLLSSVQKLFFHLVSEPTSMNKCCTHLRAPFPQNANNHSSIGSSLSLEYKVGTGGGAGLPPRFWQIRGGADYAYHISTHPRIFRPSYGPA
jgi:hypothetical protein